ncbi:PAS domain-containing protein [Hymenobacter sp. BT186]|uniref:histidine kinase n=1 Tax=Hymenobacter telluris TaxID=2816474 RepID=A0A939ESX1_9BACT|nr:PAS domain-containing protein [Hymenobacter telluris]MBO0356925.1 PAS domain-containing protein [Hymenobacter telluris]MBW3372952.1 PAS domain-containing protein [Hymenobacter norwichensis]
MTDLPDFQLLFDALPAPCLALLPHNQTVVAVNAAAQALVGCSGPLLGRAAIELFGVEGGPLAWDAAVAAVQNTKQPSQLPVYLRLPAELGQVAPRVMHLTLTPVWAGSELGAPLRYLLCQLQEYQPTASVVAAARPMLEQEQFLFLADLIPQLVWIANAAGRYQYFSARWMAYTGQSLANADIPGLWRSMTHPDDQPRVRARWRHSLSTGEPYEMEHRFRAQDGSFRWFLSQALPQRDATGQIVRWFGTSTDIDDQKRTRQLLEEKDQQLQEILSQVPAYIATLIGPNHVYHYVNERAQQLFRGQARVGLPAAQAAPELVEQGFIDLIDEVYRTGEPIVLHEVPFQSPAPEAARQQWFFNGVFQPLLNEQNHTKGILVFGIDVTEQVQAKQQAAELLEEIRQQDQEFRQALEGLPTMAWVSRPDGGVTYYNQRWYDFTGGTFEELQEWGWEQFIHPHDLPNTLHRWQLALEQGTRFEAEHRWRDQHGQYRWFLARAEAIRRPDGRILRWLGTNTDVHEERELREQLQAQNAELLRSNQSLDNFVYTTSHDLRQPLNNMTGIFEELRHTTQFRDPQSAQLVGMFERTLQQLYATINGLSELVQVQKQREYVATELVALADLTAEVLLSIQEQLVASGATVTTDFEAAPVVLFVRPSLHSILYNLLSNALKYAAPNRPPRIRVSSALLAGNLVLTIQDNGLGIDLARFGTQLFQLFRRFHSHVEGSGMGLYIVNRIAQGHGGRVEVDSIVGEGSTFRVYLPEAAETVAG